jgi:DNA-directed RNA polymerase sigma subunit (sigma70/sigma32)
MVSSAMRSLTPRQRDVLVKRYGLDGGGPCSFASIARDIGVTREAPRQIHDRAIKRIQSFIKTSQGA